MRKENKALVITSIILGIISIIAPFTYFLAALSFLSVVGLIIAITVRKKEKNSLNKIALSINSIGVLILVVYITAINYNDFKSSKTIYEYYLPKGYTGWVFIKENSNGAPPIKTIKNSIGGRYIIIIPSSGRIETSSSFNKTHHTKYFWYNEKDTVEFKAESGIWADSTYKSIIHCSGYSGLENNEGYNHFYVADKPRDPQDTVIIKSCETLFDKLKELK